VIGPGTGLGISTLIPLADGWQAIAGEGGHVDFAPTDAREDVLLQRFRRRWSHVSIERFLSGPGLVAIYDGLAEIEEATVERAVDPADIVNAACSAASPSTAPGSRRSRRSWPAW